MANAANPAAKQESTLANMVIFSVYPLRGGFCVVVALL
jgi:hypothetical protein